MSGIVVFPTLAAAVAAGFELYDHTADAYLVRARTSNGWAFALAQRDRAAPARVRRNAAD